MQLEGVVTNVTAFGAFVDVGVHQDGLVHISELADRFVKDPREVVKAGRCRQGARERGRRGPQAHRADHEVGRHRPHGQRGAAPQPPDQSGGEHRSAAAHVPSDAPAESAFAAALRRAQERR